MRIEARMVRIRTTGYLGDFKPVDDGVYELRFDVGPGYRVYFGFDGDNLILLLAAGSKRGQARDIKKAKEYWRDHLSRVR